jgi:hypothetical protein
MTNPALLELTHSKETATMANATKLTLEARNTKVLTGIEKHLSGNKKLTIGGTEYTPKTLAAVYESDTGAMNNVASTKKAFEQAVADERATHAATAEVHVSLKSFILGFFGTKSLTVLGDFGFSAPKSKGNKTVAVKAAAIEQATATRAARHTMGPKEKKKIKGVVGASNEEAATTASAETVAPATAASASAATTPGTKS